MKLPNGFGGISKLPGKRRRPWRARITTGWIFVNAEGRPVPEGSPDAVNAKQQFQTVGYFASRKEALAALSAWNGEAPASSPTFGEAAEKMLDSIAPKLAQTTLINKRISLRWLSPLNHLRLDDLTAESLDDFIAGLPATPVVKATASQTLRQVLRYAYKKSMLSHDLASHLDAVPLPPPKIQRRLFTSDEIAALWQDPSPCAKMALVCLYGGWRKGEALNMTAAMVDLSRMTITTGSKTDAGKGRTVPIHPAIQPLVRDLVATANPLLFSFSTMTYTRYLWDLNHTPHDTRHTFATAAKNGGMDPAIRKRILGHALNDITESIYTHANADLYAAEILKLSF